MGFARLFFIKDRFKIFCFYPINKSNKKLLDLPKIIYDIKYREIQADFRDNIKFQSDCTENSNKKGMYL